MKLRLTRRALNDIERIGDYLRGRDPAASRQVRDAIDAGLQLLLAYPLAGRLQRPSDVRRLTLPRVRYLIFYRISSRGDEIAVLTIRHGARKPIF